MTFISQFTIPCSNSLLHCICLSIFLFSRMWNEDHICRSFFLDVAHIAFFGFVWYASSWCLSGIKVHSDWLFQRLFASLLSFAICSAFLILLTCFVCSTDFDLLSVRSPRERKGKERKGSERNKRKNTLLGVSPLLCSSVSPLSSLSLSCAHLSSLCAVFLILSFIRLTLSAPLILTCWAIDWRDWITAAAWGWEQQQQQQQQQEEEEEEEEEEENDEEYDNDDDGTKQGELKERKKEAGKGGSKTEFDLLNDTGSLQSCPARSSSLTFFLYVCLSVCHPHLMHSCWVDEERVKEWSRRRTRRTIRIIIIIMMTERRKRRRWIRRNRAEWGCGRRWW